MLYQERNAAPTPNKPIASPLTAILPTPAVNSGVEGAVLVLETPVPEEYGTVWEETTDEVLLVVGYGGAGKNLCSQLVCCCLYSMACYPRTGNACADPGRPSLPVLEKILTREKLR